MVPILSLKKASPILKKASPILKMAPSEGT